MTNKKVIKVVLLVFIAMFLMFFLANKPHFRNIRLQDVKRLILSYGSLSLFVILLIYTLKPIVLVFPITVVSMATGNIYGVFLGSILNLIGAFLSATAAFYIARILGKDFVEKILKGKTLKLDDNIEKHALKIILFMRLSFIFPFDLLSYAAGLTKIKYKSFILGTMIGVVPEAISYALAGRNLDNPTAIKFAIPFVAILLIALFFSFMLKRTKSNT